MASFQVLHNNLFLSSRSLYARYIFYKFNQNCQVFFFTDQNIRLTIYMNENNLHECLIPQTQT